MKIPNEFHEVPQVDEISLVDLATTFLRRRRVFYSVFASIVGMGLLYALLVVGEVREYSTLVRLADDGEKTLESPQAVIASIESHWYPELLGAYRASENDKLPFSILFMNPENTRLIKLSSEASPEFAEKVEKYHQSLVDRITDRQGELLSRQKREMDERVVSLRKYLEELSEIESSGEAAAQLMRERSQLRSEIGALTASINRFRPAETLVVARESLENQGVSKKLILAVAILLGLILGVLSAFTAEFCIRVRQAMLEGAERTAS